MTKEAKANLPASVKLVKKTKIMVPVEHVYAETTRRPMECFGKRKLQLSILHTKKASRRATIEAQEHVEGPRQQESASETKMVPSMGHAMTREGADKLELVDTLNLEEKVRPTAPCFVKMWPVDHCCIWTYTREKTNENARQTWREYLTKSQR